MADYGELGDAFSEFVAEDFENGLLGYEIEGVFRVVDIHDPRKFYVRFPAGNFVSAFHHDRVVQNPGAPVRVGRDSRGQPEILGYSYSKRDAWTVNAGSNIGIHDHVRNSGREFIIDTWLLKHLRTTVVSGFTVQIDSGWYMHHRTLYWWDTQSIDLTSYIPTIFGGQRWVIVGINPVSGALVAVGGSEYFAEELVNYEKIPLITFAQLGYIPIAAVYLNAEDTQLYNYRIEDLRYLPGSLITHLRDLYDVSYYYDTYGYVLTYDGAGWRAAPPQGGSGGGGGVETVNAGDGIEVDNTDPSNPVVHLEHGVVTPGSYTSADITIDEHGRVIAAANGAGGGGGIVGVLPSTCEGRLTLSSGSPLPASDVTGAGTVYFTPYKGNVVALFDGSDWNGYSFSERSLSLSGFDIHRLYDIFIYDDSGAPTLEALGWNAPTSGSITGITNASPPVVTSNGHPLAVGDIVTIYGVVGATGANGTFRISAVTTNTFTLQTLAAANPSAPGAYTSGGTWVLKYSGNTRATALATQDGILVKSGDPTRRYLGTLAITDTAGACETSKTKWLLYNYTHPLAVEMYIPAPSASHNYNVNSWRASGNDFSLRFDVVVGVQEHLIEAFVHQETFFSGNAISGVVGVGVDSVTALATGAASARHGAGTSSANIGVETTSQWAGRPAAGLHYIHWLERAVQGNPQFVGDSAGGNNLMSAVVFG